MKQLFLFLACFATVHSFAQDRIFSFGYAKNFVNDDSSNFTFQIDLNRIPGKTESGGSFFVVNTPFGSSNFGFYLKPTADVNIGSYTTLAPNNIQVGLPFGFAYDPEKFSPGIFTLSLEFSPDFVGEKTLDQYLYYLSSGVVLNYSLVPAESAEIIEVGLGVYRSFGTRMQNVKTKVTNTYEKTFVPVVLSLSLFKNKAKAFHRVKINTAYKHNLVTNDDPAATPHATNNYLSVKTDYFFTKNLGLNFTYQAGREEPLFKQVKSLSFGLTLAR